MRTVKGLRAEELLFERLQPGIRFRGKVHSIFSSTMNLMEEGGRLWTVSIERQMYLPGTLEISGRSTSKNIMIFWESLCTWLLAC